MKKLIPVVLAMSLVLFFGCAKQQSSTTSGTETVEASKNVIVGDKGTTIVGYIISHMDQYDKGKLVYAFENAQPDVPFEWENQKAGTSYRFTYFSEHQDDKKCSMAEIYSGNKRLKACAEVRFEPDKGWIIKSQQ